MKNVLIFNGLTIALLLIVVGCSATGIVSNEPSGYHRNEYNHRYSNAPPVRDVK